MELKSNHEQAILASQLEIQEETLAYVGRELHDNLGQMLSLIKLNLAMPSEERVYESRQLLATAIGDMRTLSKTLNLHWAEGMTLSSFLRQELAKIEKTGHFETVLHENAQIDLENVQNRVIMFRIIQECLQNIMKHAAASKITINLMETEEAKSLEITDNGIGFDVLGHFDGAGLKNIRHRAEVAGAAVRWESKVGQGTKVVIEL